MNLEFNIAVHVLCFLAQHDQEQFNSKELAKLTCLNPVQLRRVLAYLTEHNYIKVQRGKAGGYQANQHTAQVDLAKLYQHFVLDKIIAKDDLLALLTVIVKFLRKLLIQCHIIILKNIK